MYDLSVDPKQEHPVENYEIEEKMIRYMVDLMEESEAPEEQYIRMDLTSYCNGKKQEIS